MLFWELPACLAQRDRTPPCGVRQPALSALLCCWRQVGIVSQLETAAEKQAGEKKSGPFARGVTAVYTKATIEAGALGEQETAAGASAADADSEDGGLPSSAAAAEAAASRYLVAVVEEPARHGGKKGAAAAHGDGGKGGLQAEVDIGLVALDASTGLVLHSQFRCEEGRRCWLHEWGTLQLQGWPCQTRSLCPHSAPPDQL